MAEPSDTEVRECVVLAWHTTNRSPAAIDRCCEINADALDLAQLLRNPSLETDSTTWLAGDALESADRPLFDEARSVAQWVAERDSNPRLMLRALTVEAGES
jgi:hypothetical protein